MSENHNLTIYDLSPADMIKAAFARAAAKPAADTALRLEQARVMLECGAALAEVEGEPDTDDCDDEDPCEDACEDEHDEDEDDEDCDALDDAIDLGRSLAIMAFDAGYAQCMDDCDA